MKLDFLTGLASIAVLLNAGALSAANAPHKSVKQVVVSLNPTKGFEATGTVTFIAIPGGVRIIADVNGLSPGKHGFHIHEKGDCSAPDGLSAGGSFNPTHTRHGGPDSAQRHVGDLGNLVANSRGHAYYDRIDSIIGLEGPNSIIGRSVIVHANEDDYKTQPDGNSGANVACGPIQ